MSPLDRAISLVAEKAMLADLAGNERRAHLFDLALDRLLAAREQAHLEDWTR